MSNMHSLKKTNCQLEKPLPIKISHNNVSIITLHSHRLEKNHELEFLT